MTFFGILRLNFSLKLGKNFDAVVAHTAIVAERFQSGEFSQPYSDPGLQMLITAKTKNINRAWVFTKPFSTSLWILIGVINIYNGLVVWLIERNYEQDRNAEIRRGSLLNQIGYMLYSAFKTLFSLNGRNFFRSNYFQYRLSNLLKAGLGYLFHMQLIN